MRRLFHSIFVLVGVLIIVFLIGHMIGDPARLMLPPETPYENYLALRKQLGFDDPLHVQFLRSASHWITGNFGDSLWQRVPALPLVLERVPATLYLTATAMLLSIPLAILLGAISAVRPRSLADRVLTVFSLGGVSTAEFWLGLMLILLLAVQLGWFKTSGYGGFDYVVLPALTLAFRPIGRIAQVTRSSLIDEMSKQYVTAARAKGLPERTVIFYHALKNAAIPILTLCGDETASLLNGAVVIETVFAWPGIGFLLIQAIGRRDLPLIEATVFVIAVMIILLNLLVDMAYAALDPRVRYH
ncbi:MAG: ABC transporter permease [Chloroflexota bacterium]